MSARTIGEGRRGAAIISTLSKIADALGAISGTFAEVHEALKPPRMLKPEELTKSYSPGNDDETFADVVADMRGRAEDSRVDRGLWKRYADRIEAAASRACRAIDAQVCSTCIEGCEVDAIRETIEEHFGEVGHDE